MSTDLTPAALTKKAAEQLTLAISAKGSALLELIREAHDRKAWAALGYRSWSAYVEKELPFSRSHSYRLLELSAGEDVLVTGGELSHNETTCEVFDVAARPLDSITPDAVLPPPKATTSEGARVTPTSPGKGASGAPSPAPSDPSGGHGSAEEQAEDNRTGGSRPARPPALDTDTPGLRPPADPFSDADGVRWLRSKTDAQVRALGDPWRPTIQSEVERWALAMGIMRPKVEPPAPILRLRQGLIPRPTDRARSRTEEAPSDCKHPVTRRLGDMCAACGKPAKAAKG